jgi:hypothetical protein
LTTDFRNELDGRAWLRQPELLDLALALDVIGEEVAVDADLLIADIEVLTEEVCKQGQEFGVRVRHPHAVAAFVALGPVEHAARCVRRIALASKQSTFGLVTRSESSCSCSLPYTGDERPTPHAGGEPCAGRCIELDVPDPNADGPSRDAKLALDFLDRPSECAELACLPLFVCFHDRQHIDVLGRTRSARRGSNS